MDFARSDAPRKPLHPWHREAVITEIRHTYDVIRQHGCLLRDSSPELLVVLLAPLWGGVRNIKAAIRTVAAKPQSREESVALVAALDELIALLADPSNAALEGNGELLQWARENRDLAASYPMKEGGPL